MLYISQENNRGHISSFNMGGSKLFSHPAYSRNYASAKRVLRFIYI